MKTIFNELSVNQNVRSNLSGLRQLLKNPGERDYLLSLLKEEETMIMGFLSNEDAKTRKNAALLLGDMVCQNAVEALFEAYEKEETLFVKSAYVQALTELEAEEKVPALKARLELLLAEEVTAENKKHLEEEIRSLRKLLIKYEGINHHTPDIKGKKVRVILLANRTQRETIRRTIECGEAKLHPMGIEVETEDLKALMKIRTFRDMVFPLDVKGFLPEEPAEAAKLIWESDILGLLDGLHKEQGKYYFRIECKSAMTLEERSSFTKKMAAELEALSKGELINSTSDYEVEIRLIATKDGDFFPCLKLSTIKKRRFTYRKNVVATSIHPSTAALIMELSKDYLKENAQIMDPFCGVGTMLIERYKKVPAKEMYGTDIFGDAILFARENTQLAGLKVNYIHRDFRDFKHSYLFDEIVTNMPVRGKKTKQEMDKLYEEFFEKAKEILAEEAIVIMYTNEVGFVKKQLRLHKEYELLQETCMEPKNNFYLLVMGYKG